MNRPSQSVMRGSRMTFRAAAYSAAARIHADRLETPYNRRTLGVIIRVMADMAIKPPSATVYIEGEPMAAGDVADVYDALDECAVAEVLDRLADVEMVRAKAYVRTVLYNAAIEGGA